MTKIQEMDKVSVDDKNGLVGINSRNFRSTQDISDFYRFISDNALRGEAKLFLDKVLSLVAPKKKKRRARKKKVAKTQ